MKKLTKKEFKDAPLKVQYIYINTLMGAPIGNRIYEEAVRDYPEYFNTHIIYPFMINTLQI